MKKLAILLGLTLTAASATALANNVGHPNFPFENYFDATFSGNIAPMIKVDGQSPSTGVVNNPDAEFTCSDPSHPNHCFFGITSQGSMGYGTVTYTIGDDSGTAPYCIVAVYNSAWSTEPATMTPQCYNGASTSNFIQVDHQHYTFNIAG